MKKTLIAIAFVLCLAAWTAVGVRYVWPAAQLVFELLEQDVGTTWAYVTSSVVLLIVLWGYYLAVMALKRAIHEKKAPLVMQVFGYLFILPPALLLDWLVNMLLTIPMFDMPGEWVGGFKIGSFEVPNWFPKELVTGRLKRYVYEQSQPRWRREFAVFMALLLDAVELGGKHV